MNNPRIVVLLIFLALLFILFISFAMWLISTFFWIIVSTLIVIFILQSIRNYNKDIFNDTCEDFIWSTVLPKLDSFEETYKHGQDPFLGEEIEDEERFTVITIQGFPLKTKKHQCNARTMYSEHHRYKAAVWHSSWANYGLWQRHSFTVRYEKV